MTRPTLVGSEPKPVTGDRSWACRNPECVGGLVAVYGMPEPPDYKVARWIRDDPCPDCIDGEMRCECCDEAVATRLYLRLGKTCGPCGAEWEREEAERLRHESHHQPPPPAA